MGNPNRKFELFPSDPEKELLYDSTKTSESTFVSGACSYNSLKSSSTKSTFFAKNSAFRNPKSNSKSVYDIFQHPTVYQNLKTKSQALGFKFHLLCTHCQQQVFLDDKNIKNNYKFKCQLKVETPISFEIKCECFKLGKKFEIENSAKKKRKMDRDCIHKKIKARLFKYIKDKMKALMKEEFSNLKIQQKMISDVTLNFNKKLLASLVKQVFVESPLYFNSTKQIHEISKEGREEELSRFISKPVKELYEEYLRSECFQQDLEKFKTNDNYASAFKAYSVGFIEYYGQEANYRKYKKKDFEF